MSHRIAAAVVATVTSALLVIAPLPSTALTHTACTTEPAYLACARAFPDPHAGLAAAPGMDPFAEGAVPAADFIQFGVPEEGPSELWSGLMTLERRYDRFLDVWTLEELLDEPDARSAGLWIGGERLRLPLIMARVTDESVPARDKVRFVFGLSLHGIERAGAEGGTRALEDLVTYAYCESLGSLQAARADQVCAAQNQVARGAFVEGQGGFPARLLYWDADSLTMGETLKRAELYFTYNNPDGWHRGDLPAYGGVGHYQRYNGNGVDPNRDWPTLGYVFDPYTPASEPETKYFAEALRGRGGNWGSGIDLHGQLIAPVLTYTMLPAGQHDYAKNQRIRAIAERTQTDASVRLGWSYLIDDGQGDATTVDVPFFGTISTMSGQQWGTVWDTLEYTITGAYGDWINNPEVGLGALGMDNEMSLSHVGNCGIGSCFVPEVEQLHVSGNKGLIYTDIDTTLRTEGLEWRFPFEGRGAYLNHGVSVSSSGRTSARSVGDLPAQDLLDGTVPCVGTATGDAVAPVTVCSVEFDVLGPDDGYASGGITADIGAASTHGFDDGAILLAGSVYRLQRLVTDHGEQEWVTLAENYSGGQAYFNNGATVAVNDPVPGRYRLQLAPRQPGVYSYRIRFTAAKAYPVPEQASYDVSNLDFFDELHEYLPSARRFDGLSVGDVIEGALRDRSVFVLADHALPGWNFEQPHKSTVARSTRDAYVDAIRTWVRGGGTLVLTDAALRILGDIVRDRDVRARRTSVFAGHIAFAADGSRTYDDPLAAGLNAPGAAEGVGARHQTYEPVPLGFAIGDGFIPPAEFVAPSWGFRPRGLPEGTRIVGMAAGDVALGEVALGEGAIRFVGALLPTPSAEASHPYGLSSYALTYSGWQLIQNLVGHETAVAPRVLGETQRRHPATGLSSTLAILVLGLVGAAVAVARLRRAPWA